MAHERLREMRAAGEEPASRSETRLKIGRNNRVRQKAILEWEAAHGRDWDPDAISYTILPGLLGITVTRMATATGLSIQYCSRIRQGKNVPHPLHWESLRQLAEERTSVPRA